MARRYGDQRAKQSDDVSDTALADEMADLMWVLCALANQTGIDLQLSKTICSKKMLEMAEDSHK